MKQPKKQTITKTDIKKAERMASRDAGIIETKKAVEALSSFPFAVAVKGEEIVPEKAVKKSAIEKQKEFIELIFSKNPVGRPRLYTTAEELQAEITNYFVYCYSNSIKLTISGLVLYCGFSDRKSFYSYEENREFSHIVKKARGIITLHYENLLTEAFPQGAVFALKNLGWSAEEKIENTVKTKTSFYIGADETEDIEYYDETE